MEHTDLYYINSVRNEKYYDKYLGNSETVLSPYNADLKKYVCNCDCMMNSIGASLCFFSIKGQERKTYTVFSKAARKKNVSSVCVCSQGAVFDCSLEKLNNELHTVFDYPLYTEEQIDRIAQGENIVNGEDIINSIKVNCNQKAVRAIMYRVAQRWLMGEKQITIAVPENVPDYNAYVMGAVKEIYSYFPTAMKIEAGFSSYLAQEKYKSMQRVYLVFMPEANITGEKLYLDGSNSDFADRIVSSSSLPEGIKIFIDAVVSINDETARKEFLNSVFYEVENKPGFTPTDYAKYGKELGILRFSEPNSDNMECFADYLNKAEKGELLSKFIEGKVRDRLSNKLTENTISNYIEKNSGIHSDAGTKLKAVQSILPLITLREDIKNAVWEKCQNWLQGNIKKNDSEVYTAEEQLKYYKQYEDVLKKLTEENKAQELCKKLVSESLKEYADAEKRLIDEIEKSNSDVYTIVIKLHSELEKYKNRISGIASPTENERTAKEIENFAIDTIKKAYQKKITEIENDENLLKQREALLELQLFIEKDQRFDKKLFGEILSQVKGKIKKIEEDIRKEKEAREKKEQENRKQQTRGSFEDNNKVSSLRNQLNELTEEYDTEHKKFIIVLIIAAFFFVVIAGSLTLYIIKNPNKEIDTLKSELDECRRQIEEYNTQLATKSGEAKGLLDNQLEEITTATGNIREKSNKLLENEIIVQNMEIDTNDEGTFVITPQESIYTNTDTETTDNLNDNVEAIKNDLDRIDTAIDPINDFLKSLTEDFDLILGTNNNSQTNGNIADAKANGTEANADADKSLLTTRTDSDDKEQNEAMTNSSSELKDSAVTENNTIEASENTMPETDINAAETGKNSP